MVALVCADIVSFKKLIEFLHVCDTDRPSLLSIKSLKQNPSSVTFRCCNKKLDLSKFNIYNSSNELMTYLKCMSDMKSEMSFMENNYLIDDQNFEVIDDELRTNIENVLIEDNYETVLVVDEIDAEDPLGSLQDIDQDVAINKLVTTSSNNEVLKFPKILTWSNMGIENITESSETLDKRRKYPESFTCEFCGRRFSGKDRAYNFFTHRNKVHTKEVSYKCYKCFKVFWGERELFAHLPIHYDPGHVCHVCGSKFKCRKTLNVHLLTHKEKSFTCQFCSKKFRRNDHCRVHERIHTGVRPFVCNGCDSAFTQKCQLKLHLKNCPEKKLDVIQVSNHDKVT